MKKNIIKTVLVLIFVATSFIVTYFITYTIDKQKNSGKETLIDVVFDDSDYYTIPNSNVLTHEEALLEWPYIFKVKNSGNTMGIYQIVLQEVKENDISRDNLSYSLYLDESEVVHGRLKNLKKDVLYEGSINPETIQSFKLYIYKDTESEGANYQYSLYLNTIQEGGPGF